MSKIWWHIGLRPTLLFSNHNKKYKIEEGLIVRVAPVIICILQFLLYNDPFEVGIMFVFFKQKNYCVKIVSEKLSLVN